MVNWVDLGKKAANVAKFGWEHRETIATVAITANALRSKGSPEAQALDEEVTAALTGPDGKLSRDQINKGLEQTGKAVDRVHKWNTPENRDALHKLIPEKYRPRKETIEKAGSFVGRATAAYKAKEQEIHAAVHETANKIDTIVEARATVQAGTQKLDQALRADPKVAAVIDKNGLEAGVAAEQKKEGGGIFSMAANFAKDWGVRLGYDVKDAVCLVGGYRGDEREAWLEAQGGGTESQKRGAKIQNWVESFPGGVTGMIISEVIGKIYDTPGSAALGYDQASRVCNGSLPTVVAAAEVCVGDPGAVSTAIGATGVALDLARDKIPGLTKEDYLQLKRNGKLDEVIKAASKNSESAKTQPEPVFQAADDLRRNGVVADNGKREKGNQEKLNPGELKEAAKLLTKDLTGNNKGNHTPPDGHHGPGPIRPGGKTVAHR